MPLFVGCDLGTTASKAAVVTADGEIVGTGFEEVQLNRLGPGWVEQDLLEIEASAQRVIRQAVASSGRPSEIAAVAISGQMAGIGAIGDSFEPVIPYDSWLDTRCGPYIQRMAEHAARVVELSGCPPTYSHGPKMLWWKHERPATYASVRSFLPVAPFVAARLVGLGPDEAFMDRSYLHFTNAADTRAGTWSAELIADLGIDETRLPRLVDPTDVIGAVSRAAAEVTGLPVGTPVAAGAGDTAAAALGAAVVRPGRAFDAAGTASVLAVCLDEFRPDLASHTLLAARGIVPGTFVNMAFINGGGLALRWFRDEIATDLRGNPNAYRILDELATGVPPGSDGLLWFPHLQGQVLPPWPDARGAWVGLTAGHSRGHLYRALLEGIAFEYSRWVDLATNGIGTAIREVRALGGGAASQLWNQVKADVLNIDWVPLQKQECGVLGDALIGAAATGHISDLARTAEAWQQLGSVVHPDEDHVAAYRRLAPAYHDLADALRPVFRHIGQATGEMTGGPQ